MNQGDTAQLVCDPTIKTEPLLDDLETLWDAEGWKVLPRIISPADRADLAQSLLDVKPSSTLLIGDKVPWWLVQAAKEGHAEHDTPYDDFYVSSWGGKIGRVDFGNLPMLSPTLTIVMYRAWLRKRLQWAQDALSFPVSVPFLDYLSGNPGQEWEVNQGRITIPDYLEEERHGGAGIGPDVPLVDRNLEALATDGRIMFIALSGGLGGGTDGTLADGLFYFGGPREWLQYDPRVAVMGGFGSMQSDAEMPNAWPLVCLATSYTVAFVYDYWAQAPLYKMLTDGWTLGECTTGEVDLYGDPMMTMPKPILSYNQFLAHVGASPVLLAEWQSMGNTVPIASGPGPVPGTPPVGAAPPPAPAAVKIVAARYRQVAHPDVFLDVTAEAQRLQDAGPWWVYDETRPHLADPFFGVLKELYLEWSVGGGAVSRQVFGQRVPVVLG